MTTNRARFDAGVPHAPETARLWGEGISDDVDTHLTAADPHSGAYVAPGDGDGVYLAYDAGNDADAARPTTPTGANYIWFNVPSEPTNLGLLDIWTSDTEVGGGSTTFVALTDTPASLGTAGQAVAVNSAGDGLEFVAFPEGSSFGGGVSNIDGGDASAAGGVSVIDGGTA